MATLRSNRMASSSGVRRPLSSICSSCWIPVSCTSMGLPDCLATYESHSWWEIDALLWDSLVAKQSGKPMLVQETGIQHELQIDESGRRTPEAEALLIERKG